MFFFSRQLSLHIKKYISHEKNKDELSHGKNAELKKIAQNIIKDQTKEIKEFDTWLDKNK